MYSLCICIWLYVFAPWFSSRLRRYTNYLLTYFIRGVSRIQGAHWPFPSPSTSPPLPSLPFPSNLCQGSDWIAKKTWGHWRGRREPGVKESHLRVLLKQFGEQKLQQGFNIQTPTIQILPQGNIIISKQNKKIINNLYMEIDLHYLE